MYSDAKKASNKRYLDKFRTVSVRVKLDELPELQAKAERAGVSLSAYMIQAARGEVKADGGLPVEEGYELVKLPAGYMSIARAAAELDGKEPGPWICQAIEEQNARDARARELRELLKGRA